MNNLDAPRKKLLFYLPKNFPLEQKVRNDFKQYFVIYNMNSEIQSDIYCLHFLV